MSLLENNLVAEVTTVAFSGYVFFLPLPSPDRPRGLGSLSITPDIPAKSLGRSAAKSASHGWLGPGHGWWRGQQLHLPLGTLLDRYTPRLKFSFSFASEHLGNPWELPCAELDVCEINSLQFRRKALVGHANCFRQEELPAMLEFVIEEW